MRLPRAAMVAGGEPETAEHPQAHPYPNDTSFWRGRVKMNYQFDFGLFWVALNPIDAHPTSVASSAA